MNEITPTQPTHAATISEGSSVATRQHIKYHPDLIQGSEEWLAARCGLLTASEMKLVVSPPPESETRIKKDGAPYKQREWNPIASTDKERAHLYELLAQRITRYVEPAYVGDDMLRGWDDEPVAKELYAKHIGPIQDMGFITNDRWGFTLGFSPDGLIEGGFIEIKSRRQKYQIETLIECAAVGTVPAEYLMQVQTGYLVTETEICDFLSFSGGMSMPVIRVYPDEKIMNAIVEAAGAFEERLAKKLEQYREVLASKSVRLIQTERRIVQEMFAS